MVNHMLGDRGDSKSHQKRGVLLSETTVTVFGNKAGDRETRLATEETAQSNADGGQLPLSGGPMLCTRTRLHVVRCHSFLSLILLYLLGEVLYFHVTTIPSQIMGVESAL